MLRVQLAGSMPGCQWSVNATQVSTAEAARP